jgi:hypothetical protein
MSAVDETVAGQGGSPKAVTDTDSQERATISKANARPGNTSKYIVQQLQDPPFPSPEFKQMYEKFARRVLWMDSNVVEGAFQMNTAWYFAVPEKSPVFEEHSHANDEIIGFLGSDPDDPYNLHGELEVWVDGERHVLTSSTMIFLPGGLKHMPLKINRVDKPIFHFSVVTAGQYDKGAYR